MKINPVMQRVARLTRNWKVFTDQPEARILRWCLKTDSSRMLDTFLAWHGEEDSELKDLFIVLPIPFESPEDFAHSLVQHLADEFEIADEDMKSMDLPWGWRPAGSDDGHETIQDFIAVAASLQMHYAEFVENVALVLMPPSIDDHKLWQTWLHELARVSYWPSNIRVLLADWLPAVPLQAWAKEHVKVVVSHRPVLDMEGLPLEILAHLPGSGPGFDFRNLFIQMGNSASHGRTQQVATMAEKALAIAKGQGWPCLAACVEVLLAGAFMAAGQSERSIQSYRAALELAKQAPVTDPSRLTTYLSTNLALSGSLVGQGKFSEARDLYREAAKLADQADDKFAAFESRRMNSYCSEQLNDYKQAFQEGQEALLALERMPQEARLQSTGPHLLQRMMELSNRPEIVQDDRQLHQLYSRVMTADWRSLAQATQG